MSNDNFKDELRAKLTELKDKEEASKLKHVIGKITIPVEPMLKKVEFNEPTHYHQHELDTITFLQKGFPPDVCMGFFKGSIIKYTQRADYKNGREDYLKIVDFAKRMLDWYDKTHS
jgi:hypothetical protein